MLSGALHLGATFKPIDVACVTVAQPIPKRKIVNTTIREREKGVLSIGSDDYVVCVG